MFGVPLCGKPKKEPNTSSALQRLNELTETLRTLEEREKALCQKADEQVDKAKQRIKANDKKGALKWLRVKKRLNQLIENNRKIQLLIQNQMTMPQGRRNNKSR